MSLAALGRTLVIANPAAQSGAGEEAARAVEAELANIRHEEGLGADSFEVVRTQRPGQAVELASAAAGRGFATVAALGGDGVIHEVANGLLSLGLDVRPRLGVVPIGSGNDYARTLDVARNRPVDALRQMVGGRFSMMDVGRANDAYFVETLSFGLDAAIALDTMKSRVKTGGHGTLLYAASGIEVFTKHRRPYAYSAELICADGAVGRISGEGLIFAVQVGPTYGGGFKVCPSADPTDGLLDICRSVKMPSLPHTLAVFFAARFGLHAWSSIVEFSKVRALTIEFEDEPPCQVDGEELRGTYFQVECLPAALEVVVPA